MADYKKTGKEEVEKYGKIDSEKEVRTRQQQIDRIRSTHPAEELEGITLREILGRKVRPVEGRRFREYVNTCRLGNITDEGKLSNGSIIYKIYN